VRRKSESKEGTEKTPKLRHFKANGVQTIRGGRPSNMGAGKIKRTAWPSVGMKPIVIKKRSTIPWRDAGKDSKKKALKTGSCRSPKDSPKKRRLRKTGRKKERGSRGGETKKALDISFSLIEKDGFGERGFVSWVSAPLGNLKQGKRKETGKRAPVEQGIAHRPEGKGG